MSVDPPLLGQQDEDELGEGGERVGREWGVNGVRVGRKLAESGERNEREWI